MGKSIIWGTCWLSEPIETLINFYKLSLKSLNTLGFNSVPIIFSAKVKHSAEDYELIKRNIQGIIILQNRTDIFPNKNYGIALITKIAKEKNIDYTAIVDSDWDIKENYSFVNNIIKKIIDDNSDIIIPNIGEASGRSNLLIGRTIINLFYPDYKNIIFSVFPGSLVCKTSKLYEIVTDNNYHYDWGGEWDIISIGIQKNMSISSSFVEVKNVRHRPNNSKMQDSFQIWRAVFSNNEILKRFNNLNKCEIKLESKSKLIKSIRNAKNSLELINIIEKDSFTETEKQILYMILYPLAYLIGAIKTVPKVEDSLVVYDKTELVNILDVAVYCAQQVLKTEDVKKIYKTSKKIQGKYISLWNKKNQKQALNYYEEA